MREEIISPYTVGSENFIKYDALLRDPGKYLESTGKRPTESQILEVLYKYGILTKHCLKKAIYLTKKNVKKDISNTLRQMVKDGAAVTYERRERGHVTVLYTLSQPLREEMENKNRNLQKMPVEKKIPDMLMRASLNQWHIGIQEAYEGKVLEERYFSRRKWPYQKGYFLSFIRIKADKGTMVLTALPYTKSEEGFKKTISYLAKISLCLGSSRTERATVIITVESLSQMEEAYRKILSVRELSLMEPFFALDINTKTENTICWLYSCEIENGAVYYDIYHLDDLMGNGEAI